jgi:hypothetical protein
MQNQLLRENQEALIKYYDNSVKRIMEFARGTVEIKERDKGFFEKWGPFGVNVAQLGVNIKNAWWPAEHHNINHQGISMSPTNIPDNLKGPKPEEKKNGD